jgi:L-ascorbate metabolism protein UlaG (beta-lactamase superfamily)
MLLTERMQALQVIPNSLAIWGLGQMGVAVQGPEGVFYIDPCLSDVVREIAGDFWVRAYPPPLLPDQITNARYIFSTHEHLDHLDPKTLAPAAKASPDAKFIVTGWSWSLMDDMGIPDSRLMTLKALEPSTLPGTSARVTVIPSAHYEIEYDAARGHRWTGYLIEWNGVTFYHGGDTIVYKGYEDTLRRLPTPDVAMVAANGRDWYREADAGAIGNLLPVEAARLSRELGWGVTIIGHNDLFPNNALPFSDIAAAFERVAPRQPTKILQPGELYYFVK